ncbi:glycoside hydrolase family 97 N-terminal domain-containing protein [Longispora fulva]|uniref:Alpha-glucosidase n=1 Tax=Longispora fulva TaxID=619741 RepID=A0A8J7KMC9_9ACTN|nr:glycoside hydrolase family 97 N-terminal domain-containing protein [Longispora fulva]MBG6133872.1 alpha-glucosidase [Longispora fulva]
MSVVFRTQPPPARANRALRALVAASLTGALAVVGLVTVGAVSASASDTTAASPDVTQSPDNNQTVNFWVEGGVAKYKVSYKGKQVVEDSSLGFKTDSADYSSGLTVLNTSWNQSNTTWTDNFGTRRTVPDNYESYTVDLQGANSFRFSVVFRVYNEGVAFRYVFPQSTAAPAFTIASEASQFNLENTATAYGFAGNLSQGDAVTKSVGSLNDSMYARPVTVVGTGYALAITEASQLDYCRTAFAPVSGQPGTLVTRLDGTTRNIAMATGDVTNTVSVNVAAADFSSPWRTIVIGDNEGQLVERSYLVKTLNPPSTIADTSWIQPGTVLRPMDRQTAPAVPLSTTGSKAVIDTMVDRGIDYLGVDARWYGAEDSWSTTPFSPIAGFDPEAIGAYADSKGKKVLLYVNYRALWNADKTTDPTKNLDAMFKKFSEEWHVDGVKFGFIPVGSQPTTKRVYDWVKLAAKYHLVVDIHDDWVPTGLERTYPNLLTMEGIRGEEEEPTAAMDLRSLFTRGVQGPADHTWGYMRTASNTSRSFRYAAAVVFHSPLQFLYWYDTPPGPAIVNPVPELWDNLPTTWDETRFLESKVASYATVARRSGNEWWVGSVNNGARTATIPLTFLTPGVQYRAAIVEGGAASPDGDTKTTTQVMSEQVVTSTTTLSPSMAGSAGYAVRLTPVRDLALNKFADQSSTRAAGGAASRAVDGNTDGNFANNSVTHTDPAQTTPPWWRVDLDSVKTLTAIEIYNRTDGYGSRLSDYWVFVSDTPFDTSLPPAQQAGQARVWSKHYTTQAGSPTSVPLPAGTKGRYVMIQLNSSGILSLAEVKAIG